MDGQEYALRTDPLDAASYPREEPTHFVAILPYEGSPDPPTLVISLILAADAAEPVDAYAFVEEDDDDGVDTTVFVESLRAAPDGAGCRSWDALADTAGEGELDTYLGIGVFWSLCWELSYATNRTVLEIDEPQLLTGRLVIVDSARDLELASEQIYFLIPPWTFDP